MPNIELPQAEFKVVVLGGTNTGKTSLVLRFAEGYYRSESRSPTVGAFFLAKRVTVRNNVTCKMLLWDTAGQAQFQKLAVTYYQNAAAAILTYDVTSSTSFVTLQHWLDEVQTNVVGTIVGSSSSSSRRRIVIAIVACKGDLEPIPGIEEEAQRLANSVNAIYIKTSAKDNCNVHELFRQVAERVLDWHQEYVVACSNSSSAIIHNSNPHSSNGMSHSGVGGSGGIGYTNSVQHLSIPVKLGGVFANVPRSRTISTATPTSVTTTTNVMTSTTPSKGIVGSTNSPILSRHDNHNTSSGSTSIFTLTSTPFRKNRTSPNLPPIHDDEHVYNNTNRTTTSCTPLHQKLVSSGGSQQEQEQEQAPETESSSDGSNDDDVVAKSYTDSHVNDNNNEGDVDNVSTHDGVRISVMKTAMDPYTTKSLKQQQQQQHQQQQHQQQQVPYHQQHQYRYSAPVESKGSWQTSGSNSNNNSNNNNKIKKKTKRKSNKSLRSPSIDNNNNRSDDINNNNNNNMMMCDGGWISCGVPYYDRGCSIM